MNVRCSPSCVCMVDVKTYLECSSVTVTMDTKLMVVSSS